MGRLIGVLSELIVLGACCCAVITNSLLLYSCDLISVSKSWAKDINIDTLDDLGSRGTIGLYRANLAPFLSGNNTDSSYTDGGSGSSSSSSSSSLNGYDGCIIIDKIPGIDDEKDAAFNCARVCAVVAFLFGATLLVFGFFKQCLCELPCSQSIMDVCGGTIQIFLALTYVIWHTGLCREDDNICNFGSTGGSYLILTQLFWLTAAIFTRCMRPGRSERRKERAREGR